MLRSILSLTSAIGTVMYKSYNTKKISKEQESMLAVFASTKTLDKKHWDLLETSGLTRKNKKYILSPCAEVYVTMITLVHLHLMSKHQRRIWSRVVGYLDSSLKHHYVVENFKKLEQKLYNHTPE